MTGEHFVPTPETPESSGLAVHGGHSDSERGRCFGIGGVTIRITADVPVTDQTFAAKYESFRVAATTADTVHIHHHFGLPDLTHTILGTQVYRQPPWAVYRSGDNWLYRGIAPDGSDGPFYRTMVFSGDHNQGRVFSTSQQRFLDGNLDSITLLPTDQIVLARIFADRQACMLHAAGMIVDGQGFVFVGHSEAGKSTTVSMLRDAGEILCDDRVIVRRWPDGFRVHGTWCHGDVPDVSPASAPLRAILLLEKSAVNRLVPVENPRVVVRELPAFVIKPLVTADWWRNTLDVIGQIAREVPVYRLELDKSGQVRSVLRQLTGG